MVKQVPAQDHSTRPQPLGTEGTAGSSCHTCAWASRLKQGHSCQPCRDLSLNWSCCLRSLHFCSFLRTLSHHTLRHTHHLCSDLTLAPTSSHVHSLHPSVQKPRTYHTPALRKEEAPSLLGRTQNIYNITDKTSTR